MVEPAYVVQGITYAQDQTTGDFAGLLYTAEDADHLYFAFEQSVFINDNTYGANFIGWGNKDHKLKDLTQSEHIEVSLFAADGTLVFEFFIDYASVKLRGQTIPLQPLGVTGGDGKISVGDPAAVTADTSLAWGFANNQFPSNLDTISPARVSTNTYDAGTTANPADL